MKCRTCLKVLDSGCSVLLTKKLNLGKTIEEILLLFVPEMVKSKLVDDFVCSDCVDTIQIFVTFIERCIIVENYLKGEDIKYRQRLRVQAAEASNRDKQGASKGSEQSNIVTNKTSRENYANSPAVKKRRKNKENLNIPLKIVSIRRETQTFPEQSTVVIPLKTYSRKTRTLKPPLIPKEEPIEDISLTNTDINITLPTVHSRITLDTETEDEENKTPLEPEVVEQLSVSSPMDSSKDLELPQNQQDITETTLQIDFQFSGNEVEPSNDYLANTEFVKNISANELANTNVADILSTDNDGTEDLETGREVVENVILDDLKGKEEDSRPSEIAVKPVQSGHTETSNLDVTNNETSFISDTPLSFFLEDPLIIPTLDISQPDAKVNLSNNRVISIAKPDQEMAGIIKELLTTRVDLFKSKSLQPTGKKRILLFGNALCHCPICHVVCGNTLALKLHFIHSHPNVPCAKQEEKHYVIVRSSKVPASYGVCPQCGAHFLTLKLLEKHITLEHKNYYGYKCGECGAVFRRKDAYRKHTKNFKLYHHCRMRKCLVCKEKINRTEYQAHFRTHKTFNCNLCNKSFATPTFLYKHRLLHQNKVRKPIVKELCNICGKLLASGSTMRAHKASHSESRDYLCDKCSKTFKAKSNLIKHMKTVHGNRPVFECHLCKGRMKSREGLNFHMKLRHSTNYEIVCHLCGRGFVRDDYYKRHLRLHCNQRLSQMRSYKKYHSMETDRKFPCKFCSKRYRNVHVLRLHLLTTHFKDTARYKCTFCEMTFQCLLSQRRHERRHRDPKAFELTCKVCWNRFPTKERLEAHGVKHVNSQRRKCELCGENFPSKYLLHHHLGQKHFDQQKAEEKKKTLLDEGLKDFVVHDNSAVEDEQVSTEGLTFEEFIKLK